ncbi:hypothetical protein Hdeb2414_s0022g00621171 [Helianthus debilis subsp. tardiflorus]
MVKTAIVMAMMNIAEKVKVSMAIMVQKVKALIEMMVIILLDSNARVEDASPDGSRLEPKFSGQNLVGPPSYENAVTEAEAPPPPPAANTLGAVLASNSEPPVAAMPPPPAAATPSLISNKEPDGFDFFDPRGPPPAVAAPSASSNAEVDLFGSLSDSFSSDVLALVPSEPPFLSNLIEYNRI